MDNLEQIKQIDWWYVLLAIVLALVCLKFLWSLADWFLFEKLGIETRKMKQRREDHEMILANSKAIKELTELHKSDNDVSNDRDAKIQEEMAIFMEDVRYKIDQLAFDRINDREKTREIEAGLAGSIKIIGEDNEKKDEQIKTLLSAQAKISNNVQAISDKIDAMQRSTDERFASSEEKQNKRVQSDIKERIAQSYRRYDKLKKITHMELEALEDLIKTYENHGGDNSFIHSVVQKEMYTWEVCGNYDNE